MKSSIDEKIWKHGLHRLPSAAEEAEWQRRLALQPEAQAEFDLEAALNTALRELPSAPVSSNFTVRVLRTIEQEQRPAIQESSGLAWFRFPEFSWARKLAFISTVCLLALLSYQQYQVSVRRELALSVAELSTMAAQTFPVIEDFQAIQGLQQVSTVASNDEAEILDAMQ